MSLAERMKDRFAPFFAWVQRRVPPGFRFALGLLLIVSGVLFTGIGAASLFSEIEALTSMPLDKEAAVTLLTLGVVLLLLGMIIRRRARRRAHAPNDLSLSPRLGKRR